MRQDRMPTSRSLVRRTRRRRFYAMPELRPGTTEYAPRHEKYVSLVEAPVLPALRAQREAAQVALASIPEDRGGERYLPQKWSVREVLGHLSDAERVYQFRAVATARG